MRLYKNTKNIVRNISIVTCAALFFSTAAFAQTEINSCEKVPSTNLETKIDKEKLAKLSTDFANAVDTLEGYNLSFIKDLGGVFDTIQGIMTSVATATVDFDIATVETRIDLASKLIQNIKTAANDLTDKEQFVLNKYGFAITGIILDTLNPLTKNPTLLYDLTKLDTVLKEAQEGPDMTPESVANVNKKEEFAKILREYRNFIFEKLLIVTDSSDLNAFQDEIARATLVRLDTSTKLKEVNAYMDKLALMKQELDKKLENLGDENIIAGISLKEELAKELRSARALKYDDLKYKSIDVNAALDKEILRLTGIRLDPRASIAEVNQAKEDLQVAVENAYTYEDVLATDSSKKELLDKLNKARFYKFNILSNKSWDTLSALDDVILSLNGVSIKINPTQSEIDEALKKLDNAVEEAKNAPDVQ